MQYPPTIARWIEILETRPASEQGGVPDWFRFQYWYLRGDVFGSLSLGLGLSHSLPEPASDEEE